MDIRNVQKTGNMYYLYLPTSWCKKHGISSDSKISVLTNSDGSMSIFPQATDRKATHIKLDIKDDDLDIINKLIVSCYINPTSSFKINLKKQVDVEKLLDQKKLISVEIVEFDGKHISCESSIHVDNPYALLKNMIKKIKNLLVMMKKNYNKQLAERYEEEIDRSNLLIKKAVIEGLTYTTTKGLKSVDLHYIGLISKDLERTIDRLLKIGNDDNVYLEQIHGIMNVLYELISYPGDKTAFDGISHKEVIEFIKMVLKMPSGPVKDLKSYHKRRIRALLINIGEVLLDWSVSKMIEKQP